MLSLLSAAQPAHISLHSGICTTSNVLALHFTKYCRLCLFSYYWMWPLDFYDIVIFHILVQLLEFHSKVKLSYNLDITCKVFSSVFLKSYFGQYQYDHQ